MSKLFEIYKNLKQNDNETLYLFKSGIFYIFLDNDAKIINKTFGLKLTNLNDKIVKCGFPSNSLQKYIGLLSSTNYKIKIIDNSNTISYTVSDYNLNMEIKKLLQTISNIDTETLSIPEAYSLLNDFKDTAQKIILKVV